MYVELVERTHDARREETREHDDENHGDNEHDPHGQGHRAEKGRQGESLLAHAHEVAIGETLGDVYGIPVQGIRMAHQHPLAGMLGGEHLRTFEVVFEGAIPDRGVEDDITGRIDERESLGAGKLLLEHPDARIGGIFLEYLGARPRLFDEQAFRTFLLGKVRDRHQGDGRRENGNEREGEHRHQDAARETARVACGNGGVHASSSRRMR